MILTCWKKNLENDGCINFQHLRKTSFFILRKPLDLQLLLPPLFDIMKIFTYNYKVKFLWVLNEFIINLLDYAKKIRSATYCIK